MVASNFDTFDPIAQQRVPIVNTKTLAGLARALLSVEPAQMPEHASKAADRVAALVATIEDELTERHRDQSSEDYGNPSSFDSGVDTLWVMIRDRLTLWTGYTNAGFDVLVGQPQTPAGALVVSGRERARQAATLLERLFGADGLSFLRTSAPEQYESAGALLRLIEEDGLRPQLEALVQPELVALLFETHAVYGTMVLDRLAKQRNPNKDLRTLRMQLSRAITRYAIAVLSLLDEDTPSSLATVEAALRPISIVRQLVAARARKGRSADGYQDPANANADGLDDDGLDEDGPDLSEELALGLAVPVSPGANSEPVVEP
jgi:hypothetical protein